MNRNILLTIIWGLVSMALYAILFLNEQTVTDYFTRGGVVSLAVIVIALVFSLVHGAFANYLIDALGFKPVNKKGGH